jgi:DNA-binding PadR family transcriptional regulator
MVRHRKPGLLLGEWACLGALGAGRLHGFGVAKRLDAEGDLGRIWTLSRPLVYRALNQLQDMNFVRAAGEEPGHAGPNRTVLVLTPKGRGALRSWLAEPVSHPRDVRTELLLKIVIGESMDIDGTVLLERQRTVFDTQVRARRAELAKGPSDAVDLWRVEFADAALRFVSRLADDRAKFHSGSPRRDVSQ